MPSKSERERRKQILNDLADKARIEFNNSLPMDKKTFEELFEFLDNDFEEGCDHTLHRTVNFLNSKKIKNISEVVAWLNDKGGYCDCEVLMNVEELFGGDHD